jgi:hypothetical protein
LVPRPNAAIAVNISGNRGQYFVIQETNTGQLTNIGQQKAIRIATALHQPNVGGTGTDSCALKTQVWPGCGEKDGRRRPVGAE